jgi:hypothetical protein
LESLRARQIQGLGHVIFSDCAIEINASTQDAFEVHDVIDDLRDIATASLIVNGHEGSSMSAELPFLIDAVPRRTARYWSARAAIAYAILQIVGCVAAAFLAHAMFVIGSTSAKEEAWRLVRLDRRSAYWFTASTSFANPGITIARALSDTFAGIAPSNAPAFIVSQLCGALIDLMLAKRFQIGPAYGAGTNRQTKP